ncbi:MAG TPA: transglycosylase domain-containing protein [Candidatus Methylomirabilis sp.]|nr:transglycosylase domain-containing protein [Candidatus Methylomirabilis sp.]
MREGAPRPDPPPLVRRILSRGGAGLGRKGILLVLALVSGLGLAWAWIGWQWPLPDRHIDILPTVRLYAGSEEIAVLEGTAPRAQVWVPLGQVPRSVVNAVLATEDRRFFRHWGIDIWAVLRAARSDLRHGQVRQGGSTITQQLARSLFLSPERTWGRKFREAGIAVALELRYPKTRILEAYLNSVYLGQDGSVAVHGLGAAARHFLRKELTAVQLDEAALLASAIRAPNRVFSGEAARARAGRDAVLQAMREQGMVSEATARQAMARPLRWRPGGTFVQAPYFVDVAREEIARRVSLPPSGEVRIQTSLDPRLQRAAERSIRDGLERIERRRPGLEQGRLLQAALVAIEPASGSIRALVGGRRYLESPFNRATRAARQPGSLFKPIVFLAAFEAEREGSLPGLTPASLIADEPTAIGAAGETWAPHNIDRRFHGSVTVRRALEESLNVPAARVAQDVGLNRVLRVAQALGIESPLSPVPSLALGTSEVTLWEITSAFATLANQGVRVTPTTLGLAQSRAVAASTAPAPPPTRAASPESSFLITHILRGVMSRGTARASTGWGLQDVSAGKTGTTDGLRDAWFVGYTPDLAIGVWVGLDDGSPLGLTGAEAALPVWAAVMQAAIRQAPPRRFEPPAGVVLAAVDRDTGRPASIWCGGRTVIEEAFRAGSEPRGGCGDVLLADQVGGFFGWLRRLFQ